MRLLAVPLLISLLLPGLLLGQESSTSPSVTVEVEPGQATIGDQLQARIILTLPAGWEAQLPTIETELGPFSVVSGAWAEEAPTEGDKRWIWNGLLAAFRTGSMEVPALSFQLRTGEESSTLESAPFEVTIVSTIEEDGSEQPDIADLKAPLSIAPEYGPLVKAGGILALLLIVSALVWWLHRRYARKLAAAAIPEDPFHRMPPHVWVYKALQELLDKRLEEQGLFDLFYSELAWILKRYTGGRYRLDLLEKTTAEVPVLLRQTGVPESSVQKISGLLARCDQVKFAKNRPGPDARKEAVETIYAVVDATKPAEATERGSERGAA
jgi:hypothetical protein